MPSLYQQAVTCIHRINHCNTHYKQYMVSLKWRWLHFGCMNCLSKFVHSALYMVKWAVVLHWAQGKWLFYFCDLVWYIQQANLCVWIYLHDSWSYFSLVTVSTWRHIDTSCRYFNGLEHDGGKINGTGRKKMFLYLSNINPVQSAYKSGKIAFSNKLVLDATFLFC